MNAPFPLNRCKQRNIFPLGAHSGWARTPTLPPPPKGAPPPARHGRGAGTTRHMSRAAPETPDSHPLHTPGGHAVGDSAPILLDPVHRTEVLQPHQLFQVTIEKKKKSSARRRRGDRHLGDRWQPRQETHPGSRAPFLPKLLLLFPTHGRGPRRAHGRGQHQAERGRRCHQAPWRSLGDPAPTAPTAAAAAGFAHGPAVPRTRSCYTRPVGHIAGCRRRGGWRAVSRASCGARPAAAGAKLCAEATEPVPSASAATTLRPPRPRAPPPAFRCRSLGNRLPKATSG